ILSLPEGARLLVLAPVIRGQKGEYKDLFADMLKRGFLRARVDGKVFRLTDNPKLDRNIKHHIEIVIDRVQLGGDAKVVRTRLSEAIESALQLGEGSLIAAIEVGGPPAGGSRQKASLAEPPGGETPAGSPDVADPGYEDLLLSSHYACTHCNLSFE